MAKCTIHPLLFTSNAQYASLLLFLHFRFYSLLWRFCEKKNLHLSIISKITIRISHIVHLLYFLLSFLCSLFFSIISIIHSFCNLFKFFNFLISLTFFPVRPFFPCFYSIYTEISKFFTRIASIFIIAISTIFDRFFCH